MASCSFRILYKEEQTRVAHFIQLIFCPLFASAPRADGSSVRDVHHLKLAASIFKNLSFGLSPLRISSLLGLWSGGSAGWMKGAGAGRASGLLNLQRLTWCEAAPVFSGL